MEEQVSYTAVGAFVIVLIAGIIFGVIWLSSGFSTGALYTTYQLNMKESVSGLNIEAPVEYNGVAVGSVKSINLNYKNPQVVEVLLKVKSDAPITEGTTATLNIRGLTSTGYIALVDKGTDTRPLHIEHGQIYPIIKTTPSLLMRLDATLGELTNNLKIVARSVQSILDKDNQLAFKRTLANVDRLTGSLVDNSQKLDIVLKNTAIASQQFPILIKSSSTTLLQLQRQLLPSANQAILNLETITSNLADVSGELKQNPALLVRGRARPALGPGEK